MYAVSIRQMLAWMQNPTAAEETTPESLGCGLAGGAPGSGKGADKVAEEAPAKGKKVAAKVEEAVAAASDEAAASSSDEASSSSSVEERSAQPHASLADALAAAGYKI